MSSGAGGPFGVIAWWQLEVAANAMISVALFTIAALILVPLARTHQLRANKLAVAAVAVFFCAAIGRSLQALAPVLAVVSDGGRDVAAASLTTWWKAA